MEPKLTIHIIACFILYFFNFINQNMILILTTAKKNETLLNFIETVDFDTQLNPIHSN